jgi:hypothetical protein
MSGSTKQVALACPHESSEGDFAPSFDGGRAAPLHRLVVVLVHPSVASDSINEGRVLRASEAPSVRRTARRQRSAVELGAAPMATLYQPDLDRLGLAAAVRRESKQDPPRPLRRVTGPRMQFFIPGLRDAGEAEARYAQFADRVGLPVTAPSQRIYAVTFRLNEITWTATVGEHLMGTEERAGTRSGDRITMLRSRTDPATVQAIIAGSFATAVFIDVPTGGTGSQFTSPMIVRDPETVEYFDG